MKVTTCIIALCLLTGCTFAKVEYAEFSMTILDLHPGGEALEVQAALDKIGALFINRDTQDSTATIGAVVDAATGL